jgi:hypothetical protein
MLRELLRERDNLRLEGRSRAELLALASAMETTAALDLGQPAASTVRRLARSSELLPDYATLLERGVFGRASQQAELLAFVAGASAGPALWDGLLLTGLGGTGKSTLLAMLMRSVLETRRATVVVLDFDRPGIDPNDLGWLESEMARQVGRQHAAAEEGLRALRHEKREYGETIGYGLESFAADAQTEQRGQRGLLHHVRQALHNEEPVAPLLLILDTFEEVALRDLIGKVADWLNDIADVLSPVRLKVIFSGRLFDRSRTLLRNYGVAEPIELGELSPADAEGALKSHGVAPEAARRLAYSEVLPRRPLELKLLARVLEDGTLGTVEDLEAEIRRHGPAAAELFAGIVYRRVLLRIRDATIRELAYPGLVLRYLSAELIDAVLVPALGLHSLDPGESARCLDKLASHEWLAYRTPDGKVWHRKDLRRSMLKAMLAQEPGKAKRISDHAIEFFAANRQARAEALYHQLLWVQRPEDGAGIDLGELASARRDIDPDLADLPAAGAALHRFATGAELSAAEVGLLPDEHFESAYQKTGTRLVHGREFGAARQLVSRPRPRPRAEWEIEALFATASWGELPSPEESTSRRRPALTRLKALLFPAMLIDPEGGGDRRIGEIERLLGRVVRDDTGWVAKEGEAALCRLLVGLILANDRRPLLPSTRQAVAALLDELDGRSRSRSGALERRTAQLRLALGLPVSYVHFTAAMIRLDGRWLEEVPRLWAGKSGEELRGFAGAAAQALRHGERGQRTVRRVLDAVDGLSRRKGSAAVRVRLDSSSLGSEVLVRALRGPDPELRDPCRFALLQAYSDPQSWRRLADLLRSVIRAGLDDLSAESFAEALAPDPERGLEVYVELADRAWALGDLLRAARADRPGAKLDDVLAAHDRWNRAVRAALSGGTQLALA